MNPRQTGPLRGADAASRTTAPAAEAAAWSTARVLVPALAASLEVRSVLQVGCGTGAWLAACLEAGIADVAGVDESPPRATSLRVPRGCVQRGDPSRGLDLGRRFDLVLAPDLEPRHPDLAAAALMRHADVVLAGSEVLRRHLAALGCAAVQDPAGALLVHPAVAPRYASELALHATPAGRARLGLAPLPRACRPGRAAAGWQPPPPPRVGLDETPRVAVVIPCHDYARFLPEAVASVAAQTWRALDCVVVDDGSTDDTAEVARQLAARHPRLDLRVVLQRNLGVAQARNAGVRAASAPLVMQLDADDALEPDAVARLVAALRADPAADLAHCDAREFGAGSRLLRAAPAVTLRRLRRGNALNYCALLRRELFLALGGYRDIRSGYDDWDLWLSAAEAGCRFVHVPEPLLRYRRHEASLMHRERARAEALRAEVVCNHPGTFSPRARRLAADVLAAAGTPPPPHRRWLALRLALDSLLAGRGRAAWRALAGR